MSGFAHLHVHSEYSLLDGACRIEGLVERARELGGEFQRKFDLVRWGIWYDQTYAYTNNATLKGKMRPCHRYYPIPDAQCALSGYVLTNDEYLADGL